MQTEKPMMTAFSSGRSRNPPGKITLDREASVDLCKGYMTKYGLRNLDQMLTPEEQEEFQVQEPLAHRCTFTCCFYCAAKLHGHLMRKTVHLDRPEATGGVRKVLKTEYKVACLDGMDGLDRFHLHVYENTEVGSENRHFGELDNWGHCSRCHEPVKWKVVRRVTVLPDTELQPGHHVRLEAKI